MYIEENELPFNSIKILTLTFSVTKYANQATKNLAMANIMCVKIQRQSRTKVGLTLQKFTFCHTSTLFHQTKLSSYEYKKFTLFVILLLNTTT